MLDKFLALLERFVVAHELIAKTQAERGVLIEGGFNAPLAESEPVKDEPTTVKAKQEEDDLENEEAAEIRKEIEREEKIKSRTERKPRTAKPKAEPEPDLDKLREEIEVMAKHIGSGDSDDCADELDDLLDEYDARSVKKLKDLQVQEFHKELKAIVAKYYDIEE